MASTTVAPTHAIRNVVVRSKSAPRATRRNPLVPVLLALCLGIIVDRVTPAPAGVWFAIAIVSLGAWLVIYRTHHHHAIASRLAIALLLVAVAAGGAAWHHVRWRLFSAVELGRYARAEPRAVCIEAIALANPRRMPAEGKNPLVAIPHGDRTRVFVEATAIRDGDRWLPCSGRTWLTLDGHLLGVHTGDRLRVFAKLRLVPEARNPGEFDFVAHARSDRILCRLWADGPASVAIIEPARFGIVRMLEDLRTRGDRLLNANIEPRYAPLASALMLGSRERLDTQQTDDFFRTGMVHALSISGLHIGILAASLFGILRLGLLRRGTAIAGVAVLILGYALVIQAEPPAVRATIIVLVACASMAAGREALGLNALAAAAIVVLAINPCDLFRAGPQLSFLCAMILAWRSSRPRRPELDPFDDMLDPTWRDRVAYVIRTFEATTVEALIVSACIFALVLPLVAHQFHIVSPVSLVLTTLLAVPIAVALVSGFAMLLVGWLLPAVAMMLGALCSAMLAIVQTCIEIGARMPAGHWWATGPMAWWLVGFYAIVIPAMFVPRLRYNRKTLAAIAAWCVLGLVAPLVGTKPRDQLTATMLSVGHGCAVVLELPDGRTMLYDAGSLASDSVASQAVAAYLWSRGIGRLNEVIVSHADIDHFNALPDLLNQFRIDRIVMSPAMLAAERDAALATLHLAIERAGVPIAPLTAPTEFATSGPFRLRVLHPPSEGCTGSDNAHSIVLSIECDGRRLLLPGDLESPGLEMLMSQTPLDCDVLMAPHHGSLRSDPPGFAAWSTPEWVIVSGAGARRVQIDEAYAKHGGQTLYTAECGAVTVEMSPTDLRVRTFRTP